MDFRNRSHRSASTEPEINLIPFIDVLLVVLIFLMLSTTYSKFTELQLKLPTADTQAAKDRPNEIIVSVNSAGSYAINKVPVTQRGVLALATALGETAPLLLIGMVAFVDNYPSLPPEGLLDPATALPVQIYVWAGRDDPGFVERSAGAIIVLLGFLVIMNVGAILLRRRFERRW